MDRPDMSHRSADRLPRAVTHLTGKTRPYVAARRVEPEKTTASRLAPVLLALLCATALYSACSDDLPVGADQQPSLKDRSCHDFGDYLHTESLTGTPGTANALVLAGDLAYVADGANGVQVIDVGDPSAPVLRGAVTTDQPALDIDIADTLACVAVGLAGLLTVDVGDPDAPVIVGGVDTPGRVRGVSVLDSLVYSADDVVGLMLFAIRDGDSPFPLGVDNTSGRAVDVVVSGALAYVADEVIGLRVVNVSDPAVPWLVNAVPVSGISSRVTVSGGYAYVADADDGLHVVDISTPGAEAVVGSVDIPVGAVDVSIDRNIAFVGSRKPGLLVIDVADPEAPVVVNTAASADRPAGVSAYRGYVYVAESNSGFRVVNVVNPEPAPILARLAEGAAQTVTRVDADATTVIAVEPGVGLFGVEQDDPLLLSVGSAVVPDVVLDLVVKNGLAFVAEGVDGLEIFDVGDPVSFSSLGHIPYNGSVVALDVVGDVVYFANGGTTFGIYVRGAETTTEFWIPTDATTAVGVDGDVAYVASRGRQIRIVDVADPAEPHGLGFVNVIEGSGEDILVGTGFIYVITSNKSGGAKNGVAVYSTQFPALPQPTSFLPLPGIPVEAALSHNTLYVALGNAGLAVIDISQPTRPTVIGEASSQDTASGVALTGGVVFIADGAGGLRTIPGQECPPRP
jgi:hypothetical protein